MSFGSDIDFASGTRRPSPRVVVALSIVTAVLGMLLWHIVSKEAALAATNRKLEERDVGAATAIVSEPGVEIDRKQIDAVNIAVAQLNVPWATTLQAIEKRRPAGVALLRIEPRPTERRLRVVAEADDVDALFGFARSLAEDPAFVSMTPVRQERVETDKRASLKLTLDLEWRL